MSHLVVISGYSGSGKSTLADKIKKQGNFAIVRSDDYHHCWQPGMDVTAILIGVAQAFGQHGISVIVDAVNKHPLDYPRWEQLGAAMFTTWEWLDMNVPIEECIRRDALRPNPVGEVAIRSQRWPTN